MVQIQDAPCHGPQVRSLRCVSGEGKENLLLSEPIHPQVRIGHTHLRVADLRRATAFYRDVLGFDVLGFEVMRYGLVDAAFLPAGATTASGLTPGTAPPGRRRRLLRATPACCI